MATSEAAHRPGNRGRGLKLAIALLATVGAGVGLAYAGTAPLMLGLAATRPPKAPLFGSEFEFERFGQIVPGSRQLKERLPAVLAA